MTQAWESVRLEHVLKPVNRRESPITGKAYRQTGIKLWGVGAYERECIDGSQTKYPTLSRVETDDLVVNKIWARNGSVAIIPPELNNTWVSNEFPTFEPEKEKLDPRWIHWITKTQWFWDACAAQSQGTSGQNRIRPEKFLEIPIPLPPLEEQKRIVARVENLAAQIAEARGLREDNLKNAKTLSSKFLSTQMNALGETEKLENLLVGAGYGTSAKCDYQRTAQAIPVLRIPNVASEKINLEDMKFATLPTKELEKLTLQMGDILVVRTNGSASLVGRCAVVEDLPEPMAFASYMIRLQCNQNRVLPQYLQLCLKHLRDSGQLIDFARTTAGQFNVSLGRLNAASIPIPTLEKQQGLIDTTKHFEVSISSLEKLQEATQLELNALLPSVLSKAFAGEL